MRLFRWLLKQPVPKQIERYSRFSPSPLSIKQFLDFGKCGVPSSRGRHRPHSPGARGRCFPGPLSPQVSSALSRGNRRRGSGMPGGSPRGSDFGARRDQAWYTGRGPSSRHRTSSRVGLPPPKPACFASNLLAPDLPALKTSQRNADGFLSFYF